MIIRLTQKLGKKIGLSPKEALPLEGNPYADWTGHPFTARRVQYILLVNTSSMFSVVLFGRGILEDGVDGHPGSGGGCNRRACLPASHRADHGANPVPKNE